MMRVSQQLPLAAMGFAAEGIWTWTAVALVAQWTTPSLFPLWACWAFYPGFALLSILLRRQPGSRNVKLAERWIIVAASLIGLAWLTIVTSQDYAIFVTSSLMAPTIAYLGWTFMERPVTAANQLTRFQTGAVAMLCAAALAQITQVDSSQGIPLLVAFFMLSFVGLAIARSEWSQGSGGVWAVLFVVIGLAVTLLSFVIISVTAPAVLEAIWHGFVTAGHAVSDAISRLFGLLPSSEPSSDPSPIQTPKPPELPEPKELPPWALNFFVVLAVLGGIVIVGTTLVFAAMLLRYWFRARNTPGVQTERLSGQFGLAWRAWLAAIMTSFERWLASLRRRIAGASGSGPLHDYRRLQRWGRQQGLPRQAQQTPYEYLAVLGDAWPEQREDFANITRGYVAVQYAGVQPDESISDASLETWRALRKLHRPWPLRTARSMLRTMTRNQS